MVNSFVVLLDITIMINILPEITKVSHDKRLKAINVYLFHKGKSEKNNSLNGHSNKPQMNEKSFVIPPVK